MKYGFTLFPVFILFASVLSQFTSLLLSEPVTGYLRSCSQATPALVLSRAWLLRHEHHLLYLLLRLAHRLVGLSVYSSSSDGEFIKFILHIFI